VERTGNELRVLRAGEDRQARANHGLVRALLSNMVVGVTKGFERRLDIQGVGFKSEVKGKALVLSLGYSHQVEFPFPAGVTIDVVDKGVKLVVKGCDREAVGQTAAQLKMLRPPDSYKGKGVRYEGETIRLKQGKTAKK
jgi:large subunit ribosomal protein L6